MEGDLVKKCNFCDMDLPKESENKGGVALIGRECLQKYLPKITCGEVLEESLSCKECLEYIRNFHAINIQWKFNEQRMKAQGEPEKNLNDKSNKNNTSTCRLCSKFTNAQESYLINDNFYRQYRKGYIQQIITLHAPFINLKLTEDPVMCLTCFNAIQTFDAFYQMCEQTFSIKIKEMKLRNTKESCINGSEKKNSTKTVTKQLKTIKNTTDVKGQNNTDKPQEEAICVISDDDDVVVVSQRGLKRKPMKFIKKPHVKKIRTATTTNESQEKKPIIPSTSNIENSPTLKDMLLGEIPKVNSETKGDQYSIVELDDSDSQDSDEPLGILGRRLMGKLETKPTQIEDETRNTTNNSAKPNEKVGKNSDVLIEINMTAVQNLFEPGKIRRECVEYNSNNAATKPSTPGTEDTTTIDTAEIPSSPSVEKDELEAKPKDFLLLNNDTSEDPEDSIDEEAIVTPCCEINMTNLKNMLDSDQVDHGENENNVAAPKDLKYYQNPRAPQAFMSSYKDFLKGNKGQVPVLQQQNADIRQNNNGNNVDNNNYNVCFPYKSHDSLVEGRRRKIDALVFEDAKKLRSYMCNLCLGAFAQESQLREHYCWTYCRNKMAKQFNCMQVDCTFRTRRKGDMRAHAALHEVTKEFVYKCDFCEFRATQAYATRHHQEHTHHKGVVHNVPKCPHCFFECNDLVIMEHHVLRRHSTPKTH